MAERAASGVGSWVPLVEYSVRKGLSLSTLRRYIKANKMKFCVENGRYLLFDEDDTGALPGVHELERQLRGAREEIAELKMLVALYEEKIP